MEKIWTYKKCYEEAQKYSSRSEFQKGNKSAYNVALKNKWLNDYCWFKSPLVLKDHIYSYEFINLKAVYVGRTINPSMRDMEHRTKVNPVSSFAKSHNIFVPKMKILEKEISIKEGNIKEDEWLKKYEKNGWTILNITKNGSLTK